jgi:hypothetical protein
MMFECYERIAVIVVNRKLFSTPLIHKSRMRLKYWVVSQP